jgi:hypothetical protein
MIICSFRRCFVFFVFFLGGGGGRTIYNPRFFLLFFAVVCWASKRITGSHVYIYTFISRAYSSNLFTRTTGFFAARQPKLSSNADQTSRRGIIKEIDKTLKVN